MTQEVQPLTWQKRTNIEEHMQFFSKINEIIDNLAPTVDEAEAAIASLTTEKAALEDSRLELKDAIKKYKKCEIKGGLINGVVTDAAGMNTLADLPSREVLLARMLGSMLSPVSGLAIVLDQIAKKGEPAAE